MKKRKRKKKFCPYCQENEIDMYSKRCWSCYLKAGNKTTFKTGYTPWNKGLHGEANPQWRGGRKRVGYGKNFCRELVENVLGRKLKSRECVHHINFNVTDDRHENLLVCSKSYHVTLHNRIRGKKLVDYFKALPGGILYEKPLAKEGE